MFSLRRMHSTFLIASIVSFLIYSLLTILFIWTPFDYKSASVGVDLTASEAKKFPVYTLFHHLQSTFGTLTLFFIASFVLITLFIYVNRMEMTAFFTDIARVKLLTKVVGYVTLFAVAVRALLFLVSIWFMSPNTLYGTNLISKMYSTSMYFTGLAIVVLIALLLMLWIGKAVNKFSH